jgi:D-amino peptidase
MRLYLSVDMEGVAGVVHEDQTNPVDPRCASEYARFRRLMTAETNAAIEGALAGGATKVLVNDSHWSMRNLLAEELHPGAALISGGPKLWSMMEGIDLGWDLAACIGYHAKAGTASAVLDHTYTSRILDVRLNGRSVGELGLNAALAGAFGTPVALVSGDQAVAAEARDLLGEAVRTVVVKHSISRGAAQSLAPAVACDMLRTAMREVVESAGRSRPQPLTLDTPVTLEVDFQSTVHADHAMMAPGIIRRGPRTIAYQHSDYKEVFRAFRTAFNLAGD